MSIRLKLVLAFAVLAGVVLTTTLALTYSALESAATQKVSQDVNGAVGQFSNYVSEYRARTALLIENAFLTTTDFANKLDQINSQDDEFGLGDDGDSDDPRKYLHQLIASADVTELNELKHSAVFLLTDRTGKVVYNSAQPDRSGDLLPHLGLLDAAYAGRSAVALWSAHRLRTTSVPLLPAKGLADDDLLLVVSQPIKRGARILGGVVLGESVMPRLDAFEVLYGGTGQHRSTRLALETPNQEFAAHDAVLLQALEKHLAQAPKQYGFLMDASRRVWAVQGVSFGADQPLSGSRAFLMRDVRPEITDFVHDFFDRRFLISTVGILLISVLLAQLIARRLSSPLIRLESAAKQIQLGNLDVQVEPLGRDEVGRLADTFNAMVSGLKQRDQIKGLFKRYLNPQVVEELLKHPEKASPGGEKRQLTLLFSDLVGFTSASERITPEELVALLNRYFETATRALARHGATLDKFIGDAIMAFWNAPLPDPEHAANACRTALALLDVVDALREPFRLAGGFEHLDCRIGINTGPCVVGNLGSTDAQYYTAIGDAVNLASRLEGACKVYGTRTLVSEDTVKEARHAVAVRELDRVRVKGRANPVRVFELLGPSGMELPPHVARYAEGLELFRARRFAEAAQRFRQSPEDPPSRMFAQRCEALIQSPPGDDWDGVHSLTTK